MQGRVLPRRHPAPVPRQDGIALVLALWLVTLISIMAAGFSYAMRTETLLTVHGIDSAQARSLAEAGLWLAVADLLRPSSERRWPADGTRAKTTFGGTTINLCIQDEAGRIDLNEADPELLLGLLEAASMARNAIPDRDKACPKLPPGLPEAASAAHHDVTFLRNAILDWRDPDHERRVPGAEDADYLPAGYEAKGGPFNSIAELRRVAGMTDEMYGKIRHAVTIHSLRPGFNPAFAPRIVLEAALGIDSARIDDYLANRRKPGEVAVITDEDHHYFNAHQGRVFTIASTATAGRGTSRAGGSTLTLTAVVELARDKSPPYSVLEWSESRLHYE